MKNIDIQYSNERFEILNIENFGRGRMCCGEYRRVVSERKSVWGRRVVGESG